MFGIKIQAKKDVTAPDDRLSGDRSDNAKPKRGGRTTKKDRPNTRTSRDRIISAAGRNQRKVVRVGLLLIVGIAGVSGGFLALARSKGETTVYAAANAIPKGARIQVSDLRAEIVPLPGITGSLPLSAIENGYASVTILPGEVLTRGMALISTAESDQGGSPGAVIGVALAAGRLPATGLSIGTTVEVIYTGNGTGSGGSGLQPGSVLGTATVSSSAPGSSGSGMVVDLVLPAKEAPAVAAAASGGGIAIARVS